MAGKRAIWIIVFVVPHGEEPEAQKLEELTALEEDRTRAWRKERVAVD